MNDALEFDPIKFKLMDRAVRRQYTEEVRTKFVEAVNNFLANPTKPPVRVVRVKGRKLRAWHIGYSGWDGYEGPVGYSMQIDEEGNLHAGLFRRSISRLTAHQMIRAIGVLGSPHS